MKKLALLLALFPLTAGADKQYNGGKGATWDCAKDPIVSINHARGKYTIKGVCDVINVNGASNTFTIENVDVINVNGAKNTITLGTVDTINVAGMGNTITYKKGKDPDSSPQVGDQDLTCTCHVSRARARARPSHRHIFVSISTSRTTKFLRQCSEQRTSLSAAIDPRVRHIFSASEAAT